MSVSFRAASEGVPQGGVISPLLSNIMLNEFDQYLHERYLSGKARKDRWYWNNSIQRAEVRRSEKTGEWKPAVACCRYADDFVLIVKGTKARRKPSGRSRGVLEGSLKLRLNMDKTKITHVNDGFIFLGTGSFPQTQSLWRDASGLNDPAGRKPETSPHR